MRLEPFRGMFPVNAQDAKKLAHLDWPSAGNAAHGFGFLKTLNAPALLAYRIQREGHADAWGLIGMAPCLDYASRNILPHEETLVETVRVRCEHLAQTQTQTGPVLLAGKGEATNDALALARNEAQVTTPILHLASERRRDTLWALGPRSAARVQALLANGQTPLIVDGHHRAKATASCCESMLVALFAEKDFSVGACERLVAGAQDRARLAHKLSALGLVVTPSNGQTPASRHAKLWDGRAWHDIALGDAPRLTSDSRLLQDKVFSCALGIADPTTDPRLSCLPACEDPRDLEALAQDDGIAFRLHPADLALIYQMANQGQLMPPKTTWFTPKPLPGIVAALA